MNYLSPLAIGITESPLTSDVLDEKRKEAFALRTKMIRRNKMAIRILFSLGGLSMFICVVALLVDAPAPMTTKPTIDIMALVAVAMIAFVFGGVAILIRSHERFIGNPLDSAEQRLLDISELSADKTPGACIEYDRIQSTDAQAQRYHNQIIAMGRRPIQAEYQEIKSWIENANDRISAEKTRGICSL